MRALFLVIDLALELYIWIVIAMAIFSWLVAFNVVNTRNLGGIDISPVILFLIIVFIRYVIALYILPYVY
jgi:YggT family protein